jgi:hypothetical protein
MLSQEPRRTFVWGLVVIGLGVVMSLGVILVRSASSTLGSFGQPNAPRISHDIVVERLREVAKLVATEMTLRDVVVYEQTRLRSTKRVLLVVTARVSAGINLNATKVDLDSVARKITITLPPAQITSVDVTNLTTYDESAGLWNPFTSDDRDEIQRRVRAQMRESAARSGILEHADQAAAKALRDFLTLGGYLVDIRRPLELRQPGG